MDYFKPAVINNVGCTDETHRSVITGTVDMGNVYRSDIHILKIPLNSLPKELFVIAETVIYDGDMYYNGGKGLYIDFINDIKLHWTAMRTYGEALETTDVKYTFKNNVLSISSTPGGSTDPYKYLKGFQGVYRYAALY